MELSDYDLLGITPKATFRIVKNAYYELSRIYHPDSSQIIIGMTKKDREIAFQRIQTAYENIKEKMNVVEVDLPS
jgi:DnaJ-class molecular chaperone